MKVFEQFKNMNSHPSHDALWNICDWKQFENDPRTSSIDLHLGPEIDFSLIRSDRINIHMWGEWPNSYFNGKRRGQNSITNERIAKVFDYVFSYCKMCVDNVDGFMYVPNTFDFNHIYSNLSFDYVDEVEKDIDVFMCATAVSNVDRDGFENDIWSWFETIKKFNYVFCNSAHDETFYEWADKQELSARSKISVVFADFVGSTIQCREFSRKYYPWIKFKQGSYSKPVYPAPKLRVFDAVFSKSIVLCKRSPFCGEIDPYSSAIEHYLTPGEHFIYFDDCEDLNKKIEEILSDYKNPKYKKMVDSAYNHVKENFDLNVMYEKYIVPIAEKNTR